MDGYSPTLRRFLLRYFGDQEITNLCFDYFPDVYQLFADSMDKGQKIQRLLDHCRNYERWHDLLATLERERPQQYDHELAPQVTIPAHAPHLRRQPPDRNSRQIFISHAHQDKEMAYQLADDLQAASWSTWLAWDHIRPGEKWVEMIGRGLESSGLFLLLISPAAADSYWVNYETNLAIQLESERKMVLIPLLLMPTDPIPIVWRGHQYIPLQAGYQQAFEVLLDRLGHEPVVPKARPAPSKMKPPPDKPTPVTLSASKPKTPTSAFSFSVIPVWGWGLGVFFGVLLFLFVLSSRWLSPDAGEVALTGTARVDQTATQMARVRGTETAVALIPLGTPTPTNIPTTTHIPIPTNTPVPPTLTPTNTPTLSPFIPPPNATLGSIWIRPTDQMPMVHVPAGRFMMGSDPKVDADAEGDELPQHEVILDAFWIDRYEVSNAQFAAFLNEAGNQSEEGAIWLEITSDFVLIEKRDGMFRAKDGFANHPVVEISWYGAAVYCDWVGGTLPTEAQWEYAARGDDGRLYPWGNEAPTCDLANVSGCRGETAAVGTFSPAGDSWVGAADMAGNVWEWVFDWWGDYPDTPQTNPTGVATGGNRIRRGGSYYREAAFVRSAKRFDVPPNGRIWDAGYRCVFVRPG